MRLSQIWVRSSFHQTRNTFYFYPDLTSTQFWAYAGASRGCIQRKWMHHTIPRLWLAELVSLCSMIYDLTPKPYPWHFNTLGTVHMFNQHVGEVWARIGFINHTSIHMHILCMSTNLYRKLNFLVSLCTDLKQFLLFSYNWLVTADFR